MENKRMYNGDTLRAMLSKADRGGYAIPSFNYSCIWDFLAIIEAAEEMKAPIMIASHFSVFEMMGPEICAAIGATAVERTSTPLIYHLDHSSDISLCKKAIDLGYPSVMIDASALSLEDNIRAVKEVTAHARKNKVCVEAEIGKIKGRGYEGGYEGKDFLAQVDDARRLVEESGTDTLAVGIGTAHGFYEGKPEIHFDRLEELNAAIDVPLVLHGGSGIPEEDIRRAITGGINKVNVGTIIHSTLMNSFRSDLMRMGENQYTLDIARPAMDKVKEAVRGWIRACMADGKG
jgi:ketose-bisphosphate aldolase